ncbi:hypothetical protein [Streptomyces sp. NBC_01089]|uniref:hypothetical protein n=1 Tax=Streptomyces sp. NBC_01089 TaxID=2903747 RepID=UPI00386B2F36|nr:hypothetical protein OG510_35130 [Streptomyces sp. NBC_01089]
MTSFVHRIIATKAAKVGCVAALAAVSIGLTVPTASASNESSWSAGCRGYWYSTAGDGYCKDATAAPDGYWADYDCSAEVDTQNYKVVPFGFVGKFNTHECTFKINKTHVHL